MQSAQGPGGEAIRVLVADDTRIHTQLLADALRRDRQLEVISPPARFHDLAETLNLRRVRVLVLSSNLDEKPLRGFEVLRELRVSNPGILAIMLLDSSKREAVLEAFRSGARGIFGRHDSVETLSKAIQSVYQGQIWANSQEMSYAVEALAASPVVRAVDANGLNLLSKRELEVVRCLAEGLTNREIGERLGLSQHTIKNYLFRVYDKLGVSSRLELLFMTMTQTVAPQWAEQTAQNRSNKGNESQRLASLGSVAKNALSQPSGTRETLELGFPVASSFSDQETKGERQKNNEEPWEAKSKV